MIYLDEYMVGRNFSQKSVMVCGASVSLPHDLYEVPNTDFIIACNHHTLILKPDFLVALDPHTMELLTSYRGMVMAKHDDADIHIGVCPSFGFSGAAAVWIADYMGFQEIIMVGFDCYLSQGRSYWHDGVKQKKPHLKTTVEQQSIIWEQVKASVKNSDRIRVMSGYLQTIFKEHGGGFGF